MSSDPILEAARKQIKSYDKLLKMAGKMSIKETEEKKPEEEPQPEPQQEIPKDKVLVKTTVRSKPRPKVGLRRCEHILGNGEQCPKNARAKYCYVHKQAPCHREEAIALGIYRDSSMKNTSARNIV